MVLIPTLHEERDPSSITFIQLRKGLNVCKLTHEEEMIITNLEGMCLPPPHSAGSFEPLLELIYNSLYLETSVHPVCVCLS